MYPSHRRRPVDCTALVLDSLSLAPGVAAANQAVKPKPGGNVIPRNVCMRPTYRPGSSGTALIVDPSARREVTRALGTEEPGDAGCARPDAVVPGQRDGSGTVVEKMVGRLSCGVLNGSNDHLRLERWRQHRRYGEQQTTAQAVDEGGSPAIL